jgi:polyphenol oxidase
VGVAVSDRLATVLTTRADGDLNLDDVAPDELADRQQRIVARPWTMLRQVHGADVVTVTHPGEHHGVVADAMVVTCANAVGAVWSGDCAPVVFHNSVDPSVFAIAHAGWKGIANGVLAATVERIAQVGASGMSASIGPYIHSCCYEFGQTELAAVADALDVPVADIAGTTRWGALALDVRRAVEVALQSFGISVTSVGPCTGCDDRFFSYRVRGDRKRHALAVWRPGS